MRHRGKIESTITNAGALLAVADEFGTFDEYVWEFVGGRPIVGEWDAPGDLPSATPESAALSRDLKRRGFRFGGVAGLAGQLTSRLPPLCAAL